MLILCFFVLIVSFSEIKEDDWQAMVEEMVESLGLRGGGGRLPTEDDPKLTLIERLEQMAARQDKDPNQSSTEDPGIEGRDPAVTAIRAGQMFAVGGRVTFEPGSAVLSANAKRQLRGIVETVRGYNNIIEIRGHAAPNEVEVSGLAVEKPTPAGRYTDLWRLSSDRAQAVMEYLTSEQNGLRESRFRLIANADREPLARQAYSAVMQAPNRRAEVFVSEMLIDRFTVPEGGEAG